MQVQSSSPEQTEAFGARLAAAKPSSLPSAAVIFLTGDLGAGKTTLARGFLHACGVTGAVRSPTYTLVENYEVGGITLVHLDLYRLRDPGELEPLGLRDLARANHLWLVEWPERGAHRLPPADLTLSLQVAEKTHLITASAGTAVGQAWFSRLA